MKALILNNKVVQVEEQEFPVSSSLQWLDCADDCQVGWLYNPEIKEFAPEPIPEKTQTELLEEYKQAMQAHIDQTARSKDYDNGISCASYFNSSNETWKAEALAFLQWRDACWQYAIVVHDEVSRGVIDAPSLDEFSKAAPKINW